MSGIAERKGRDNLGVIWKIENIEILKERKILIKVILKMGNSLNEVFPFLLHMVTFRNSDFQYLGMMASLEKSDARGKSGDAQFWRRTK